MLIFDWILHYHNTTFLASLKARTCSQGSVLFYIQELTLIRFLSIIAYTTLDCFDAITGRERRNSALAISESVREHSELRMSGHRSIHSLVHLDIRMEFFNVSVLIPGGSQGHR